MARKLKIFKFDVGNSSTGPLGMVMRVYAHTKPEAVEIANKFLAQRDVIDFDGVITEGIEYCNIYFGTLTINHIDASETEELEEDDEA